MRKANSIQAVIKKLKREHVQWDYMQHSANGALIQFFTYNHKLVAKLRLKKDMIFKIKHDVEHFRVV